MQIKKALIAISAAAVLVVGTGSLVQAASDNDGGNDTGGYVLPGNLDGVNPVYHPFIFGSPAAAEAYGFAPITPRHHAKPRHRD